MSYNITAWKISALSLELPPDFDFQRWLETQPDVDEKGYENTGKRWCKDDEDYKVLLNQTTRTWELPLFNEALSGVIADDGRLIVTDIVDWTDDFSGHLYSDILIPLFKEFKGSLSALVVWEGGDRVVQLDIRDGIVESREL